ncbi:hypothetical protein BP5796_00917 [Coleophoma crateriformis]|uniref:Clock-controlled protein 8 n=1 Tax=Coleophoma crateriformis TaxID=565419 RepID=A0A3D8T9F5_9HELO|nr:hypothetical protein BP5796_00917 [Coleophoma crateriformis]
MEQQAPQREQPPSYQSHDPQSISLPPAPPSEFAPIHHERKLPPLPATPVEARYRADTSTDQPFIWPSSNPLTAYYQPGPAKLSPIHNASNNTDSPSAMDLDVSTPDSRGHRGGSVLSIDDPDVRLAAEALGDLRADFITSPPQSHTSLSTSSPATFQSGTQTTQNPEPLLSLLTTSHPLIGNAIGGSLSAYSASKNYSPRFKSSAEYVERRFTPVVNTVGTINRITGVEGGVRWFLGSRRPSHHAPSDLENGSESHKRRRFDRTDTDQDMDRNYSRDPYAVYRHDQQRDRRPSQTSTTDSLPAYDDYRSPSYEATQQALVSTNSEDPDSPGSSWQSRLVLSTSGLSVAMSEESLRSLKYCLGWLRWANEHIGKVTHALKTVLEQYEAGPGNSIEGSAQNEKSGQLIVRSEAERSALAAKVAELKSDVLKTLKNVVDIVSKYAGGALPENAKELVRKHLTSLPQRFRLASTISGKETRAGEKGDRDITEGAKRVMVLAKEGLDMMAQVSGVLDGTIVSAEEWCERLGRKKREEAEAASQKPAVPAWHADIPDSPIDHAQTLADAKLS